MDLERLKKEQQTARQRVEQATKNIELYTTMRERWIGIDAKVTEWIAELEKATEPPKP